MTIADAVLFCCFAARLYDSDTNWFWSRTWFKVVAWGCFNCYRLYGIKTSCICFTFGQKLINKLTGNGNVPYEQKIFEYDCLFVVWIFLSPSRIFYSFWVITITGEGIQNVTYTRYSSPLSSEGFLTCHTFCDTGQPFKMVISEDPWHSHLLPSVLLFLLCCHYLC